MLRPFTVLLAAALTTLAACSPKPTPPSAPAPTAEAFSKTAETLILPWHQAFVRDSNELRQRLESLCQNPSNPGELEASREAWRTAMLSWQVLQVVNFGPVQDGNQAWRVQFWPDTHNRVGQKVEALLEDETPIDAATLAQGNVLVQGLSALEYVLFDPSLAAPEQFDNPRVCLFLQAAAANTQGVAEQLLQEWSPEGGNYLKTFLSPGKGNLAFPETSDVLAALVGAIVTSMEKIKNKELGEPFGGRPNSGRINPYRLELWRSQLSLQAMQAELAANEELFRVGVLPVLEAQGHKDLADRITAAFKDSREHLAPLPAPLFTQLQEPDALPLLQAAWDSLGRLLPLLKTELPTALQVHLGFNSSDGD